MLYRRTGRNDHDGQILERNVILFTNVEFMVFRPPAAAGDAFSSCGTITAIIRRTIHATGVL